jgi:hypothetical protein
MRRPVHRRTVRRRRSGIGQREIDPDGDRHGDEEHDVKEGVPRRRGLRRPEAGGTKGVSTQASVSPRHPCVTTPP